MSGLYYVTGFTGKEGTHISFYLDSEPDKPARLEFTQIGKKGETSVISVGVGELRQLLSVLEEVAERHAPNELPVDPAQLRLFDPEDLNAYGLEDPSHT